MSTDKKINFDKGIGRKKVGDKKYEYFYNSTGKNISKSDQERINKLRVPPNLKKVWVSLDSKSHVQAVGYDDAGRLQYIYHEYWKKMTEQNKYLRLKEFIKQYPKLKKYIKEKANPKSYDKESVYAMLIYMLAKINIRVGSNKYAKRYKSYGLTTLLKSHVKKKNGNIHLVFLGKSKQKHNIKIENKLIKEFIISQLMLENDKLFHFVKNKKVKNIYSDELNSIIKSIMGQVFFAKDFRTYSANIYFLKYIKEISVKTQSKLNNKSQIKKNLLYALGKTAERLGHTRAMTRKSYVMDFLQAMYVENPYDFTRFQNPNKFLLDILSKKEKELIKTRQLNKGKINYIVRRLQRTRKHKGIIR